ncbi:MAG: DNA-binding protein [Tindallia sp. MSAO_Bac2]|nr:MAG: DNA-binding protein [Tindallia sp. MSAO_Bac2]
MEAKTIKSLHELPVTITVGEVAEVLGISRTGAYEVVKSEGFPCLKVGRRLLIPRDQFINWIERKSINNSNGKE